MTSPTGSRAPRASRSRSDSPSTSGMVKYGRSATSPAVSSGTMWGWWHRAQSAISRSNRSALVPAATSGRRTLTTTCRPSLLSVATKTRDIPPAGSSRSIVYPAPRVCWSRSRRSPIGATSPLVRRPAGPRQLVGLHLRRIELLRRGEHLGDHVVRIGLRAALEAERVDARQHEGLEVGALQSALAQLLHRLHHGAVELQEPGRALPARGERVGELLGTELLGPLE